MVRTHGRRGELNEWEESDNGTLGGPALEANKLSGNLGVRPTESPIAPPIVEDFRAGSLDYYTSALEAKIQSSKSLFGSNALFSGQSTFDNITTSDVFAGRGFQYDVYVRSTNWGGNSNAGIVLASESGDGYRFRINGSDLQIFDESAVAELASEAVSLPNDEWIRLRCRVHQPDLLEFDAFDASGSQLGNGLSAQNSNLNGTDFGVIIQGDQGTTPETDVYIDYVTRGSL